MNEKNIYIRKIVRYLLIQQKEIKVHISKFSTRILTFACSEMINNEYQETKFGDIYEILSHK